uniref:Uncharacterized protein n=1 Tax=Octopus bimaculoides TaxID=37653 RepID=A0A0L8GJ60_OCTBM
MKQNIEICWCATRRRNILMFWFRRLLQRIAVFFLVKAMWLRIKSNELIK